MKVKVLANLSGMKPKYMISCLCRSLKIRSVENWPKKHKTDHEDDCDDDYDNEEEDDDDDDDDDDE